MDVFIVYNVVTEQFYMAFSTEELAMEYVKLLNEDGIPADYIWRTIHTALPE